MGRTVYLVDASTFIHRGYHAIRDLSTRSGLPTNAVYGFIATIHKLLRERKPEFMALAFDAKGKNFRHGLYPEYKANRPPMPEDLVVQQEPIRRIIDAMGLRRLEVEGLEADDLIASMAVRFQDQGHDVVIVSADKDFFQLLSPQVRMYDPNPKREQSVTEETLRDKFGLTPRGFLEAQGLMGDATDNIPGVPGVGEKTAAKLIGGFGDLETLYDRLDQVPQAKLRDKLAEHREAAFLSRDLARLETGASLGLSLEDLAVTEPDVEALRQLYQELEFTRFAAELGPAKTVRYDDYHLVRTPADLDILVQELAGAERLSVDTETTSVDPMRARLVGLSLAAKSGRAFYLPVGHQTLTGGQLDWSDASIRLGPLLESAGPPKVGQNLKYDYIVFKRHGLALGPIGDDSMIASYLLDPGLGGHNLERISKTWLNHDPITYQEVVGDKKTGFDQITPEAAREYACEDADLALRLAAEMRPALEEAGLLRLYEELELPLVEVLAEMEMNGVRLDEVLLGKLSEELGDRLAEIESRVYRLAGREFNINSPKQLGQVLFEDLGLSPGKKTKKKSGWSTDMEVLTELAPVHELPAEVLNYRTLAKLKSTYVEALVQLIHPETGRVHTSFNQTVTATGRLSSSEPNLQNIPVRTDEGRRIRQAFIPDPGRLILSADYSQIELRVLAHYSGDPGLQAAFRAGDDVHTRTAAEVHDIFPALVTPEMRREAKAVNFGIVYGLQAFGLAKQLGIERKAAQEYIDRYFKRYAGVKDFIDLTLDQARRDGFVTTLLGRRRLLPELGSKNYQVRSMAERMAVNTPIQGSAADLIKLAMLAVHRTIRREGLDTRMLLQVHDELVFEVPQDELETIKDMVKREMEGVYNLDVPLVVDVNHGPNWAEAH
ncbi:MAG: DNA polymerase I [Proteobacteria bacterium]|nr:DNA polymerase I [Pseudomonadota bacterium]